MTALNKNGRNTNEFVRWMNKEFATEFNKNMKELFFKAQKQGFEPHAVLAYLLSDLSISHTEYVMKLDIADKLENKMEYPTFKDMYEAYQKHRDQSRPAPANSDGQGYLTRHCDQ